MGAVIKVSRASGRHMRTEYLWKCQDCGGRNSRSTGAEPRRCTHCGAKGVQLYLGTSAAPLLNLGTLARRSVAGEHNTFNR